MKGDLKTQSATASKKIESRILIRSCTNYKSLMSQPKRIRVRRQNATVTAQDEANTSNINTTVIDALHAKICAHPNPTIKLLRDKTVLQWLFGDCSFLGFVTGKAKTTRTKQLKELEDKWGRTTLKSRRPDLALDQQWTNNMGQHITEELFMLQGKEVSKPTKINHFQLDTETNAELGEAKAQTYFTSGTAAEKILGTPVKYSIVPKLTGKPLMIVCMANAEKLCREQFGLLGNTLEETKQQYIDLLKSWNIHYVGATDMLKEFLSS